MTARARIGFDARMLGATGLGRYIEGLLPELVRQGQELEWVVFARAASVPELGDAASGARLVRSDAAHYRLAEQTQLLASILGARLDLLHVPHYNAPMLYRGPLVVTIHDLIPVAYPQIHSGWLPRAYNRLLIQAAARRAAAIITPSQATAADVQRRLHPRGPIIPIPEGVAPRWFANGLVPDDASTLARLSLPGAFFLYVGQWKPYRNIVTAIRALSQVRRQAPNAQLAIAGRVDPRYPEIPGLVAQLGLTHAVRFLGVVPDDTLQVLYRNTAALVLPSRQEGFGLPVLEAMAGGAPVVCSDIPALRETGGDVAVRCPPDDEAAFAAAMLRTLDPVERARRAAAGRRHAAAFTWSLAAARTLQVYRDALAAAR
jgi:glycosyltransferase involved in cell wall biosynthesis